MGVFYNLAGAAARLVTEPYIVMGGRAVNREWAARQQSPPRRLTPYTLGCSLPCSAVVVDRASLATLARLQRRAVLNRVSLRRGRWETPNPCRQDLWTGGDLDILRGMHSDVRRPGSTWTNRPFNSNRGLRRHLSAARRRDQGGIQGYVADGEPASGGMSTCCTPARLTHAKGMQPYRTMCSGTETRSRGTGNKHTWWRGWRTTIGYSPEAGNMETSGKFSESSTWCNRCNDPSGEAITHTYSL